MIFENNKFIYFFIEVEIVNMLNGNITSENPMQEERHNVGVVVVGEGKSASLYVIGGYGIGKILRTVERYCLIQLL